jgi:poly-gamma-glutamate capsule biosynthesis protein CapA/YwtB (metallophosphatase superfamily)
MSAWLVVACSGESKNDPLIYVTVKLVDERGSPVSKGRLQGTSFDAETDGSGNLALTLTGPELLLASGEGTLTEPVIVGNSEQHATVTVKLWDRKQGTRRAMHFGGDVMFGRRYSEPTSGEPLLVAGDIRASAERIVEPIARAFAAADYSVVNLETVVSNLSKDEAYPGKRFLLNSPPDTLAGLEALGVDLASMANNHTRDWMESGLQVTLEALDERKLSHVGAGLDAATATLPHQTTVAGLKVTTLAYTSVNGTFVNDNYPNGSVAVPDSVTDEDVWIWELREFAFSSEGFTIDSGRYRIGDVWQRYSEVQSSLSEEQQALAWQAMTAVYPELQDWVARRGHGGAANYSSKLAKRQVAEAKAQTDLVIVQLHAGYQFQSVASESLAKMAHDCIDAGADLVVAHHPHVLQGVEFYRDKLIVHSLGNFVFDQDFLSTFSTGFLRTVWENDTLLEARFIPIEIASYRPHAVADRAAERVFARLWESSVTPARAARVGGGVYPIRTDETSSDAMIQLTREWGTVRLTTGIKPTDEWLTVSESPFTLPRNRLFQIREGQGFLLGRELFGWGDFEDVLADGREAFGQNFVFDHVDKLLVASDAANGRVFARLRRDAKKKSALWLRPVARVALARHRLYEEHGQTVTAVDPEPQYSLRAKVRTSGDARPRFRVDTFHFDDTNPTEDPSSRALTAVLIAVEPSNNRFEQVEYPVELPETSDGVQANMVMLYVGLEPPKDGESTFDVDDLQLVEWRDAASLPPVYGAYDYVKRVGTNPRLKVGWISSTVP